MDEALLELTLERSDAVPKCERSDAAIAKGFEDGNSAPKKMRGSHLHHMVKFGETPGIT